MAFLCCCCLSSIDPCPLSLPELLFTRKPPCSPWWCTVHLEIITGQQGQLGSRSECVLWGCLVTLLKSLLNSREKLNSHPTLGKWAGKNYLKYFQWRNQWSCGDRSTSFWFRLIYVLLNGRGYIHCKFMECFVESGDYHFKPSLTMAMVYDTWGKLSIDKASWRLC